MLVVLLVVELVVLDDELLELVVVDDELLEELVVVVDPVSSRQGPPPISPISVPLYEGGPEHSQPCPQFSTINTHVEPFH